MKKVIGIGVMLKTQTGSYLLQERDMKAKICPGMIAPFGGGIEVGETAEECVIREMNEELNLSLGLNDFNSIRLFESHNQPGVFIHMFLAENIDKSKLILTEGRNIIEMEKAIALTNEQVTDFTKEVLRLL